MKKRIISLLMALLMLATLLPTAVWAEGEAPEQAAAATDSGAVEQEPAEPETPETPVESEQPTEPEAETPSTNELSVPVLVGIIAAALAAAGAVIALVLRKKKR